MSFPSVAAAVCIALIITGCGGGSTTDSGAAAGTPARCFELVEGASRAVIKIESTPSQNDPEAGSITIYSYVDGVEEFTPETTAGRLEADAFVYGDGTSLALTADTLTWPQDSLLEGAVFTSTSCP